MRSRCQAWRMASSVSTWVVDLTPKLLQVCPQCATFHGQVCYFFAKALLLATTCTQLHMVILVCGLYFAVVVHATCSSQLKGNYQGQFVTRKTYKTSKSQSACQLLSYKENMVQGDALINKFTLWSLSKSYSKTKQERKKFIYYALMSFYINLNLGQTKKKQGRGDHYC